jgi:deazaflavin-dependent oxidoreductase (nitroreductase family)
VGRLGARVPGGRGRMLLLDHVGAKSGTLRTSPLLYVPDGENLVLVASKGGFPKHPAWFHNLRANPEVEVSLKGGPTEKWRAAVASPEERARMWPLIANRYRNYRGYQERTQREIPLVLLTRS